MLYFKLSNSNVTPFHYRGWFLSSRKLLPLISGRRLALRGLKPAFDGAQIQFNQVLLIDSEGNLLSPIYSTQSQAVVEVTQSISARWCKLHFVFLVRAGYGNIDTGSLMHIVIIVISADGLRSQP
jgi:hypothetical protein